MRLAFSVCKLTSLVELAVQQIGKTGALGAFMNEVKFLRPSCMRCRQDNTV